MTFPLIVPVLLVQNAQPWKVPLRFSGKLACFGEGCAGIGEVSVGLCVRGGELADHGLEELRGDARCAVVLRVMKVAMTGQWEDGTRVGCGLAAAVEL